MPRKAVHESELTNMSIQDPDRLLDSQLRGKTSRPESKSNSRIRDFLRHARLLLPGILAGRAFSWTLPTEQRKVAAYQNRRMALLNSFLHLVPLVGATVLLIIFWTKHWVGGDNDNATTLQFVAKFHEILMQSSLVDILLYIIRAQALQGYVPLGALSGAAQAPQISYLWSLDFASALKSPHLVWSRKAVFITSVTGLLFMASVVGPSSAVLMIPRSGLAHVTIDTTDQFNISEEFLFPTVINSTHNLNFSKFDLFESSLVMPDGPGRGDISYIWPTRNTSTQPYDVYYSQSYNKNISELIMWISAKSDFTFATLPTDMAANNLVGNIEWDVPWEYAHGWYSLVKGRKVTIRTAQPLVREQCFFGPEVLLDNKRVFRIADPDADPDADSEYYNRSKWASYSTRNGSETELFNITEIFTTHWRDFDPDDVHYPPPIWMAAPDDPASLVGVFLQYGTRYDESFIIYSCTLSSY